MASVNYAALDTSIKQIRLLTIRPADPLNTSDIRESPWLGKTLTDGVVDCTLETRSLKNEKPRFLALSYTWGIKGETRKIVVNGQVCEVGINLEEALRHIRQRNRPVTLWADAICINQLDDVERGEQVRLMGKIYSEARSVYAWLGPSADDSDLAMDALDSLGQRAVKIGLLKMGSDSIKTIKNEVDMLGDEIWPDFPHVAWQALSKRPYWTRLWVIQEVYLPPAVGILCGSKLLNSNCLLASTMLLSITSVRKLQAVNTIAELGTPESRSRLDAFLGLSPETAPGVLIGLRRRPTDSLLGLLNNFCMGTPTTQATDPRDMIYGLVGMAADADDLQRLGFRIDYSRSTLQTYISITKILMRQGHTGLLAWSQLPKSYPGWPTWVPDFSAPIPKPRYEDFLRPLYAASKRIQRDEPDDAVNIQHNDGTILLKCVKVDTIKMMGSVLTTYNNEDWQFHFQNVATFLTTINSFCSTSLKTAPSSNATTHEETSRLEAYWRVACADQSIRDGAQSRASLETREDYNTFLTYLDKGPDSPAEGVLSASGNRFVGSLISVSGQCPFLSTQGYVGLAPATAMEDDLVCIMLGSTAPFVFREVESGKYELIGEAYVDGIMDGEFMENGPEVETLLVI